MHFFELIEDKNFKIAMEKYANMERLLGAIFFVLRVQYAYSFSSASQPIKYRGLNMMDYVTLGSSDLQVSKICLGTMTWGQQNSEEEAFSQLDLATQSYGVNFLDTAEMYPIPTKPTTQGATDRILANWLKSRNARSKVILATKVAGFSEFITWLPGRDGKGSRVRRSDIIVSVDESLKRLGTDYIDLLQIHW